LLAADPHQPSTAPVARRYASGQRAGECLAWHLFDVLPEGVPPLDPEEDED
jgi:hypothetical protein